jgi:glycosyltransferase involved in cell wall biosynthesis
LCDSGSFRSKYLTRAHQIKHHGSAHHDLFVLETDVVEAIKVLGSPARPSDETYVASLRKLSRDLRIDAMVRFVPGVSTDQLADWYRKCTVHINMTQAGFGDKVALEAMACARPCIVANTDFQETLGRFTPGLLYNYGDPESLSVKLESLRDRSPEERHQMGVYLREQVIRLHSVQSLAKRIVHLLETLRNDQRLPA